MSDMKEDRVETAMNHVYEAMRLAYSRDDNSTTDEILAEGFAAVVAALLAISERPGLSRGRKYVVRSR